MNLSRPFIMRPVATGLLMVALLLTGMIAYRLLPVSALPQVDYPTIQVLTFYPGASPDVMSSSVTAPLERQFGQMPGLNQMTSTSSGGASVITLQFSLDLSLDVAEQEVQAAINSAFTFLPKDLPNPPVYSKVNPADAPVLTLALTSTSMPLPEVEDLADTRIAQKISQLPGVGLVSIGGGQRPAVRVQANPTALASYDIGLEDIRAAIAAANVNQAKGTFDGERRAYTIGANDQLLSSKEYRPLIVAYRNGAAVHLSDIADVIDDAENVKQAAWMNEVPAVILNIQRQPGANVIQVADRVKRLLPQLQASLPSTVQVALLTDRTYTIRAVGARRAVRADAVGGAGGDGDLSVPAQSRGHRDSECSRAAVSGGHARRDVSARVQPRQSVADGAHHRHRLRRRRRDRHDREHRALRGGGRAAAAGGAERREADRLHHLVVDGLADRGADSAVVHERCGGTAVSRVRDHVERDDSDLGSGIAHAHADDVRASAQAPARARAGPLLPRDRRCDSTVDRCVCAQPALGARSAGRDADRRRAHAGLHGAALHRGAEGLLPGPGYRCDPGNLGGAAEHLVRGDGAAPAGAGSRRIAGSRRAGRVFVHRHRRHQRHAQQRAHPDQPEADRPTQRYGKRCDPPAPVAASRRSTASRCTCSRCRICPSRIA